MNEESKKFFDEIKKKAQSDTDIWNAAQKDETIFIANKEVDEIMERMFLVYYTEQYLEQQKKIERLETELLMRP